VGPRKTGDRAKELRSDPHHDRLQERLQLKDYLSAEVQ
jgi:hypothetical protein